MSGRIETLDQELQKLKEIVLRLAPLAQNEMLNYRMIESQHSQLESRNAEIQKKIDEAETQLKNTLDAKKTIEFEHEEMKRRNNANVQALYAKAYQKFKDVEKFIEDADKSRIKKSLKELEAVAA